jgi:serine/threonine-protein kinase HipA
MVKEVVDIHYLDHYVGAVLYDTEQQIGYFEYDAHFIKQGHQLSPIMMPLSHKVYSFPEADRSSFKGLPGLLADSLPDDFGNAVLNAWVASQGLSIRDITPTQRLQYTGKRGMGALEYKPATQVKSLNASRQISIESLVSIAQEVLDTRAHLEVNLSTDGVEDKQAMMALLSVGMSAGGARPKAVLAFNQNFTQVRSGQAKIPAGFEHYLLKFDGVSEHHSGKETFGDPLGYSAMEYVYYLMAVECGIDMMPCRLLEEGRRRHFLTQRFDRIGNQKVHVQTLNGLVHKSYKQVGSYSYEELFSVARLLKLSASEALQLFKRMVFNVIARNHDDHSKNFGFVYDGQWKLAPAYDIAYSYRPGSPWVDQHWMSINGKRDHFTREDFYSFERLFPLFKKRKIDSIIAQTIDVVSTWRIKSTEFDVPKPLVSEVEQHLRLNL